jgi:drug/metabolite transporter (DMT)-like permease
MRLTHERKGDFFILTEAILWGLLPVFAILSFASLSPLVSLGWSTFFAIIFFGGLLAVKKRWHEIAKKESLKDILYASIILGIAYHLFYFFGLKFSSAGNVSLIALTEIFFSFLFFQLWRKDHLPLSHIFGALLMLLGAGIVLSPNFTKFHWGDIFILIACFIAPFGNFFQKRARKNVSSETILFIRSLISAPLILILASAFGENIFAVNFSKSLLLLLVNGFLMFGLAKALWIEGIHRISVTKANALSAVTPLLTLSFAWIILHNTPTTFQLLAFVPMFFGVVLLSKNNGVQPLQV